MVSSVPHQRDPPQEVTGLLLSLRLGVLLREMKQSALDKKKKNLIVKRQLQDYFAQSTSAENIKQLGHVKKAIK